MLCSYFARRERFHNGSGRLVLADFPVTALSCSPSGAIYLLEDLSVKKLVGSTLQTVIDFNSLPARQQAD